ncbi:hypothetical protein [Methanolobus profundi]|uniref:Uncharacterized protein n=1 Tax=Methanolobus profundi TaxID=487685 RepID=A0A1I4T2J8_9EURY|nr:hypothetical protein [Methanolobus profundi]SFM70813.1 hypothetical protein SAMN04488696_2144 [Methanolobus profundi]
MKNEEIHNPIFLNITINVAIVSIVQYIMDKQLGSGYSSLLSDYYSLSIVAFVFIYVFIESNLLTVPRKVIEAAKSYFLLNLFIAGILLLLSKYASSFIIYNKSIFVLVTSLLIAANIAIPLVFCVLIFVLGLFWNTIAKIGKSFLESDEKREYFLTKVIISFIISSYCFLILIQFEQSMILSITFSLLILVFINVCTYLRMPHSDN